MLLDYCFPYCSGSFSGLIGPLYSNIFIVPSQGVKVRLFPSNEHVYSDYASRIWGNNDNIDSGIWYFH